MTELFCDAISLFCFAPILGGVVFLVVWIIGRLSKPLEFETHYTPEERRRGGYWLRHHDPVTGEEYTEAEASGERWINYD